MKLLLAAALASLAAAPVAAQDAGGRVLSFDLGLGAKQVPVYPGAEDTEAAPWVIFRNLEVDYGTGGGGRASGFYVAPSADLVGGRDEDEDDALEGLDEIDRTLELGVRAGFRYEGFNTYATLRRGFGGHEGIVAEFGTRYSTPIGERVTLTSGIEADYGGDDYMDTFFGVTDEEAGRSIHPAYNPDSGFKSVSALMELRYQMTPDNAILGRVKAERLIGDAADSPLVEDRDQVTVGIGFVHTFRYRF